MPDDQLRVQEILARSHVFTGLRDDQILQISREFEPVFVQPEDILLKENTRSEYFYLVYRGSLKVSQKQRQGEKLLEVLLPGDYIGEEALLRGTRSPVSAVVIGGPAVVFRLKYDKFKALMRKYPQVRLNLQMSARTRRLARVLKFGWLNEGETIYLIARRHPAVLLFHFIWAAMVGVLAAVFFTLAQMTGMVLTEYIAIVLTVVTALLAIWIWLDWRNDYYLVTSQRVIWLEKIILVYDNRQEAPLGKVLSLGLDSSQIGRILGFGNVNVNTFTGRVALQEIANPQQVRNLVDEYWKRSQEQKKREESEANRLVIQQTIRQQLGVESQAPQKIDVNKAGSPAGDLSFWDYLWRDFVKMRIEEPGQITYRKHWLVLIGQTWVPGLTLLAVLYVLIAFRPVNFWLSALICFGIWLWWLYQYVDWRNDIFRVTTEKIFDIDKKPLGSEQKREAPLDNILSMSVDKHGFHRLLFNYGNVIIDVSGTKFIFENIYDPAQAQQEIFQRQMILKSKKQEAEELKERRRMAEWLEIYHREVTGRPISGDGNPG